MFKTEVFIREKKVSKKIKIPVRELEIGDYFFNHTGSLSVVIDTFKTAGPLRYMMLDEPNLYCTYSYTYAINNKVEIPKQVKIIFTK